MNVSASLSKKSWRRCQRAVRAVRAAGGSLPSGDDFARHLLGLEGVVEAEGVAAFVPVGFEPKLFSFLNGLSDVLLPRLYDEFGHALEPGTWAWWSPGDRLESGRPGAPLQPTGGRPGHLSEVGLVLLPALAVDGSGTRLGQGGGWYDRALLRARPDAVFAAVVYNWEFLPAGFLPHQSHDQGVDFAVTDRGAFDVRSNPPPAVIHS